MQLFLVIGLSILSLTLPEILGYRKGVGRSGGNWSQPGRSGRPWERHRKTKICILHSPRVTNCLAEEYEYNPNADYFGGLRSGFLHVQPVDQLQATGIQRPARPVQQRVQIADGAAAVLQRLNDVRTGAN